MLIYQVDTFTNKLFSGNPAAVCPLEKWISDEQMQEIAMENNLPDTAFFVPKNDEYEIRWFTPKVEVKLCGHATLATAYVIFEIMKSHQKVLRFHSLSGVLTVSRAQRGFMMNFPSDVFDETNLTNEMTDAIGLKPVEAYFGRDVLLLVLNNENELSSLNPDFSLVKKLHKHGLIITAPGDKSDFVSRCFFPNSGINEDPVTGSAHTILTPYWADRLKKNEFTAFQISKRRGELWCKLVDDRVEITGEAVLFMKGEIAFNAHQPPPAPTS